MKQVANPVPAEPIISADSAQASMLNEKKEKTLEQAKSSSAENKQQRLKSKSPSKQAKAVAARKVVGSKTNASLDRRRRNDISPDKRDGSPDKNASKSQNERGGREVSPEVRQIDKVLTAARGRLEQAKKKYASP